MFSVFKDPSFDLNALWGNVSAEVISRLGVNHAVVSPGLRSAHLATGFANHPKIKTVSILDERSAAFYALGKSLSTHRPVVAICSSGTASANFYPAIIEASMSHVPILIFTADRPPKLHGCSAPQAIDQVKIYGDYARWQLSLSLPERNISSFSYLRQTLQHAVRRANYPNPGPVHLNFPFREINRHQINFNFKNDLLNKVMVSYDFYKHLKPINLNKNTINVDDGSSIFTGRFLGREKGLIVIGSINSDDAFRFSEIIKLISETLGWPIISDSLNPVRSHGVNNALLVCNYDSIIREREYWELLSPERVLLIGSLPISKILRKWLRINNVFILSIESCIRNIDPLHVKSIYINVGLYSLLSFVSKSNSTLTRYFNRWCKFNIMTNCRLNFFMQICNLIFSGKIPWLMSKFLPSETLLIVANSTPVRDFEFFWQSGNLKINPCAMRGVNGIDGIVGYSLGVACRNSMSVLVCGDLSFLHDSNGLLFGKKLSNDLVVILINNHGGGIFEKININTSMETFEQYFILDQRIDWKSLIQAYGVSFYEIYSWEVFIKMVKILHQGRISIIYLDVDRKIDVMEKESILNSIKKNQK